MKINSVQTFTGLWSKEKFNTPSSVKDRTEFTYHPFKDESKVAQNTAVIYFQDEFDKQETQDEKFVAKIGQKLDITTDEYNGYNTVANALGDFEEANGFVLSEDPYGDIEA